MSTANGEDRNTARLIDTYQISPKLYVKRSQQAASRLEDIIPLSILCVVGIGYEGMNLYLGDSGGDFLLTLEPAVTHSGNTAGCMR